MTKDKVFTWKFCLCCGIFIWFIINLLQGVFTAIHEDEAYYALFGEHLAWGYFDHPPMVALMTILSSHLFSGTLGVRFCTIIVSCFTLLILWHLLGETKPDKNKVFLFFVLVFSVLIVNLYGFVTTPDAALLLFSALFLLTYQRYLNDNSWKNALLMGLLMALMVYSKYHAFLLLGLIVLSNLKLLKDGKFYVACLIALALLTPHILWQVNADFPSFRYHLSGRSEPFRWSYFLEYLPNQLLVFNPFVFGAVVYVLCKAPEGMSYRTFLPIDSLRLKPRNDMGRKASVSMPSELVFERGLKFILIGFVVFFWLMSFRGHVEQHWTAVGAISAVVLLYRNALVDHKLMKYIKRVVAPSLLLVLAIRIAMLTPMAVPFGFCQDTSRYEAIASEAGTYPVAFRGSFQQPALYHYFTGNESSTLRCYYDRKTQYDLWQFDTAWIGQPVYVDGIGHMEHFQSANRLEMEFRITNKDENQPMTFRTDEPIHIDFSVHNSYPHAIDFQSEMLLKLLLVDDNKVRYCSYTPIPILQPNETYHGQLTTQLGPQTRIGENHLLLCIGDQITIFGDLKKAVEIEVVEP